MGLIQLLRRPGLPLQAGWWACTRRTPAGSMTHRQANAQGNRIEVETAGVQPRKMPPAGGFRGERSADFSPTT
jgi:hypothetical protein